MALVTPASLVSILDEMVSVYLRIKGTSGSAYGVGEPGDSYGAIKEAGDLQTAWGGLTASDAAFIAAIGTGVVGLQTSVSAKRLARNLLGTLWNQIEAHVKTNGYASGLDSALTYWNVTAGTKWQALMHPRFRELYDAIYPNRTPTVNNVYFSILQGAVYDGTTFTNALRKLVVSGATQTAGDSVDTTKYCGGFPKVVMSGFTGSSDTVTVTGTQYNPATQTTTAAKTWTATVNANGTFALAPGGGSAASADSLIVACSAVTAGANITAGTIYVEAHRPTGRNDLP